MKESIKADDEGWGGGGGLNTAHVSLFAGSQHVIRGNKIPIINPRG